MFSDDILKNPESDVTTLLEKMSDSEIRDAVESKRKDGTNLLAQFAKYRNEKEFIYLIDRLPSACLERVLPSLFSILSRGANESQNVMRKINTFQMMLAHQSLDAILHVRSKINTIVIYEALTIENSVLETERCSWKKLIALNNKLKDTMQTQKASPNSPEKKPESKCEYLIRVLEEFIQMTDQCKTLTSETPRQLKLGTVKMSLELCMGYRDTRPEFLEWNLLHFVCAGIYNKAANPQALQEIASRVIKNLNATLLSRIHAYTCRDPQFSGCNLLHFVLLHIQNMDDIKVFCSKANDETLNIWLCHRLQCQVAYKAVPLRNFSALQMMLLYLNLPSLQYVMSRTSPKTLFLALVNTNETRSANELLDLNPQLKYAPTLDKVKQQIYGTRLFYELYNFCVLVKEKRKDAIEDRIEWVRQLMQYIENHSEAYTFCTALNKMYVAFKLIEDEKVLLQYLSLRPFNHITNDICAERNMHTIKDGYEACKQLFHEFFMPVALMVPEPPQRSPSPKKKVKFSTQDNEVQEFPAKK